MSPSDKSKYEEIYSANKDHRGDISFEDLAPLYESLDVPDTDIRSAWNLVNARGHEGIGKDACLAFLHILNMRHEGYRVPRSVPPSLRASFEKGNIEYNIDRVQSPAERWGVNRRDNTTTGRKAKFGDAYLSRLGIGDKGKYMPKGTDFSGTKTSEDWEEVRLKKQLRELDDKLANVEQTMKAKGKDRREDSKPALVKRELEQLLEYKRRQLRDLELGEGQAAEGQSLKGMQEEIQTVREQVEGLEQHLRTREGVLEDLKRQIEEEKRR
ncbi:actin cytoskeleton-regulatory complex protein END3-domain-containing protein [Phyllosticta citribraziliensis]